MLRLLRLGLSTSQELELRDLRAQADRDRIERAHAMRGLIETLRSDPGPADPTLPVELDEDEEPGTIGAGP